jgi:polysaccharide deacetylase family protein (PEP-CTERM system associated)
MKQGILTIDVEDWFHILDCPQAPPLSHWSSMESRVEPNTDRILETLVRHQVKATLFWLGWVAERHKSLVCRCRTAGHEIASHGYAHLLPYQVGEKRFRKDIEKARKVLEDVTGSAVNGFRAPGFGITAEATWTFDVIREAGYMYDSSLFPSSRGHGGMTTAPLGPHLIKTRFGGLPEIPMSMVNILGRRVNLFGGGYLRISPVWLIRWGIRRLHARAQPLVVYLHPREIDPDHPRLPLGPIRYFKSYVNLKSTLPKLEWLCTDYAFCRMDNFVRQYFGAETLMREH